jgi:hypothetical protein
MKRPVNSVIASRVVVSEALSRYLPGWRAGCGPGFYHINVVPINTQTWKSGVYIFAVAVTQRTNKGQTLASVLMDREGAEWVNTGEFKR